ncbi:serine hydrolase [candidate division KSB1 bacterium]
MNGFFKKPIPVFLIYFIAGCGNESNPSSEAENSCPTCSIVSPSETTVFYLGDEIEIRAEASDIDGDISVVRFLVDEATVSLDSISPYNYVWDSNGEDYGNHQLRIIAYDDINNSSSSSVEITLNYRYDPPELIDDGWAVSSLFNEGLDSVQISGMMDNIFQGDNDFVRSILIARNGRLVLEEYRPDLNSVTLHHMQSATKSVASALIGIAIDRGHISGVDVPIFELFPEHNDMRTEEKNLITLEHILTMTPGLEWNETSTGTFDQTNDNIVGHQVRSYLEYALSKPVLYPPGTTWFYNSGCSVVLGGVIRNTTGMQAVEFAQEYLFAPLGIEYFFWGTMIDGVTGTHGMLWMCSRDQAKIGQLFLDGGMWNGERIISEEWVQNSTEAYIPRYGDPDCQYGYQWWVDVVNGYEVYYACGYGGQRIFVIDDLDMVLVTTSDYDDENRLNYQVNFFHQFLYNLIHDCVLPAAR